MTTNSRWLLLILVVFAGMRGYAQKSAAAKQLFDKAVADSTAKEYIRSAEGFILAAQEELKLSGYDAAFAGAAFYRAGYLYDALGKFEKAHEAYYACLPQFRKAGKDTNIYLTLKVIATLYEKSRKRNIVYQFPRAKAEETITATRSIDSLKRLPNKSYEAVIDGGSNDGIYEGADAEVFGKHITGYDRANRLIGSAKITAVYPDYSKAIIQLINPSDTFYAIYPKDMVAVPIRFPKLAFKDIFLEVSLMNIRFVDNSREMITHPRTMMYYSSQQLEKEIYNRMLAAVEEVYQMIKDDTTYNPKETITRGRFKGITWKQAMSRSTPEDLKAFLGFVRSYPGKYMGGTWKISETYATWLLNNAPFGSNEMIDSLFAAKTDVQFRYYMSKHAAEIKDNFFTQWQVDAQNMGFSGRFADAYKWNAMLQKVAQALNDQDMIGWSLFNLGRIKDEEKKYDDALSAYQRAKAAFEKGTDRKGLTFTINNLGFIYGAKYMYKESQQLYEQVLDLRLKLLKTDTSDEQKVAVARSCWGIGDAYYNQSKYKEAIEQYSKGLSHIANARSLEARKQTATLNRLIGKSYEKMGEYEPAAAYYQNEYQFQRALGDVEAQADALDNQAYLLSKVGKYREALGTYELAYRQHLQSGEKNDAGFSMSNIGQTLWSLGKFDSAITAHNRAIALRQEVGNKKGEAYSWKKIGGLYKESGDATKSMEAFQKALDLYKNSDAKSEYGELLEDLGANYVKIKDYSSAEKYYFEALALYRTIKSRNKEASLLSSIGNMFYEEQKYARADEYFVQALNIQKEINDRSGLMYSYTNRALVAQFHKEDFKDAISKMKIALSLAEETQSESNLAFCLKQIGSLYSYINEYDSALQCYDKSLAIYRRLEDKENQAGLLINYGYYYNYRGEFEKGRAEFEKALDLAREINSAYTIAAATYGLMNYQYTLGNFPEALKRLSEVLAIYREKDNPWGIASAYLDQGNILNQQGEFDEALAYYYKTDSIYKKLSLEKPRISITNNIGTIYYHQKNFDGALKQFEQTRAMLEKFKDDPGFMALIKSNIGEVYVDQKKNKEADKWLQESLQMAAQQKNYRQLYISNLIYGRLQTNLQNYTLAEKHFRAADSALSRGGEKTLMIQLLEAWGQMLYKDKKPVDAEKKLLECVRLSDQTQYRNYAWKAYSTLADIQWLNKNSEVAINYLKTAIGEVEKIKSKITGSEAKKIFASDESVVELYQKMVVQLKKEGRVEEALVYMEKANAENVKLRLNSGDITYTDAAANEALAKEKELRKQQTLFDNQIAAEKAKPEQLQHKEQIAQWEKMRSITAEQYKSYVNDLKIKYPNLQAFKTVDPAEFMAQRRRIPADVAAVSYLVTDNELSVFVVMKDTIFIKDIPVDRALLQQKIKTFYAMHARSSKATRDVRGGKLTANPATPAGKEDKNELAADLYDLLVAPLIKDIGTKQRVAIVPSGFLCFVPFDALMKKESNGSAVYFGEQKQLFYVNKITTVTNNENEPLKDFRVIAVGNADKSLPNAETEVKNIQLKMPQTVVYVREQATKKNVLGAQGDYNILHLATHGVLDYSNADSSYLVLASDPANNDDGKLTIAQIQAMTDIDRFRFILLSACETAVIREVAEGWPISMGTAFIEMGVPSVIATLWQVDDKATSMLLQNFYENLKTMDKVQALQQAQLFLKKQPGYEDPYYWAPFQLVGLWK